jgi:hypothetical protein
MNNEEFKPTFKKNMKINQIVSEIDSINNMGRNNSPIKSSRKLDDLKKDLFLQVYVITNQDNKMTDFSRIENLSRTIVSNNSANIHFSRKFNANKNEQTGSTFKNKVSEMIRDINSNKTQVKESCAIKRYC